MRKNIVKKYLGNVYTKNGKIYKVFEVDPESEMVSIRNLEKSEIVIKETFKKFEKDYKFLARTV